MKNMKKLLSMLLVAGCLMSCGGCGSNDIEETNPAETELTETETTERMITFISMPSH